MHFYFTAVWTDHFNLTIIAASCMISASQDGAEANNSRGGYFVCGEGEELMWIFRPWFGCAEKIIQWGNMIEMLYV